MIAILLLPLTLLGLTSADATDDEGGSSWLQTIGTYFLIWIGLWGGLLALLTYLGFTKLFFGAVMEALKLAREAVVGLVRAFV